MKNEKLFIPSGLLKKISDENENKFNRSIDVDMMNFTNLPGVVCIMSLDHEYAFLKKVEPHKRLVISFDDEKGIQHTLTQDVSMEQYNDIVELNEALFEEN